MSVREQTAQLIGGLSVAVFTNLYWLTLYAADARVKEQARVRNTGAVPLAIQLTALMRLGGNRTESEDWRPVETALNAFIKRAQEFGAAIDAAGEFAKPSIRQFVEEVFESDESLGTFAATLPSGEQLRSELYSLTLATRELASAINGSTLSASPPVREIIYSLLAQIQRGIVKVLVADENKRAGDAVIFWEQFLYEESLLAIETLGAIPEPDEFRAVAQRFGEYLAL